MCDLTDEEKEQFLFANVCHICERPLTQSDTRVRDHDHFTGKHKA